MITKWGIEMRLKKKYEADLNMYKEGRDINFSVGIMFFF